MKQLTIALAFILSAVTVNAQLVCGLGEYQKGHMNGCEHGLQGTGIDEFTYVPPPEGFVPGAERSVVISVVYNGFSPEAQTAFQFAVDIWASLLTSSVPITLEANWQSLSGGTLGFAGADGYFRNFPGAIEPNTFYPAALANKLRGSDNDITSFDLSCTFNSNANWYYGTDGNTPGGQYDFVTVVLHELCHGLGFIGSGNVSGSTGFLGLAGDPIIYDRFIEELDGDDLVDTYASGTTALGNALTSNQLYWNGAEGIGNNNGNRPRIYAPGSWNGGSSYSHLNEGTYGAGSGNALMTPFVGTAEAHHDPGPIVEGIFTDIGWTVGGCIISNVTLGTQTPCNPATNTYNQQIILEYTGEPAGGLISVNGNLFTIQGSPQTINIIGLPSDGQGVDLDIFFTSESDCMYQESNAFTAPQSCCDNVRITAVDTDVKQITLTNYGSCAIDASNFILGSEFSFTLASALTAVDGSIVIPPAGSVTLQWNVWNPNPGGSTMELFAPGANLLLVDDFLDFVQWGSGGNGNEALAVSAGYWGAGDFVSLISPYSYTGDGSQYGVAFWQGSLPPCSIDNVTAGAQTACDPMTNLYSQEIVVEFTSAPTTGSINVNGTDFAIGASPQTINLTDLSSDGNANDVLILFTDEPTCSSVAVGVFTAPANCFCPADLNNSGYVDIADFLAFLSDFGCTTGCVADFDGDGSVGAEDLLIFTSQFDTACP
ncbi:hypothetical protein [Sanyastnella coralliicola]|uniref:hypothetical protein n=1 Tax=Sanyastnella coralliicola TaxID=3069118 RepID=UPI0027B985D1|nr:hypothetical protein [Longitalea sp. SCSIO 12813]